MSRRRASKLSTAWFSLLVLLATAPAQAAPEGHQVVLGNVTIEQNPDGSVTLIHASDGSIIEYDSFDILAGELVQFIQPGADARVLNRVFGDATQIDGSLLANGIVYIVNPAGVFLNGGAVIEVGGLVAAAGNLTNEDFVAGIDRFELTGPVVNASDEVRGDLVALLGTRVENHGRIESADGVIALVAGEKVVLVRLDGRVHVEVDGPQQTVAETGVVQAGHLDAVGGQVILAVGDHYSLAINHTGVTTADDVELRGGDDGTLLVRGVIDASSDDTGGSIRVLGDRVALLGATLDASGAQGGGEIRIGGDLRGEGALPTATRTYVDADSVLRADATAKGDGGSVVVWGDEAAVMAGTISARGGAGGGDGGFVEVSSLGLLDPSGSVDLGADAGLAGTFLLDPQDIVIIGGSADGSDDPNASASELAADDGTLGQILFGDVGDGTDPFEIYESEIEGTNANLVLEARNSVSVSGTFDNDAGGEGTGVVVVIDDNDLTIRTRNDTDDELGSGMTPGIDLGTVAWQTGGTGSIAFSTGDDGAGGGGTGVAADLVVGDLSTAGGSVDLSTRAGNIVAGNVDTSGGDGASGANAGSITIAATTGDVSAGLLTATGGEGLSDMGGDGGQISVSSDDGAVTVASVDVSGGQGATEGGDAGTLVSLRAGDGDGSGGSAVSVGDVWSRGGAGLLGDGGDGGTLQLTTSAMPGSNPAVGGGPISLGNVDTTGGDGTVSGGDGGRITVFAQAGGGVTAGDLTTRGGDADSDASLVEIENGGTGGAVELRAEDGDVVAGAIDSSGGDGTATGLRGGAGDVDLLAGVGGSGSMTLSGPILAVDGDGAGDALNDGLGVRIFAQDDVAFDPGIVGPDIRTTENVSLSGDNVGATHPIEIDAVGLTPDPVNETRILGVQADRIARVDVTTAGFDTFLISATTAEADIDVTQAEVLPIDPMDPSNPPGINIDLDGAPTTATLVRADMRDEGIAGGVELRLQLEDDLAGMDDVGITLAIGAGAIHGTGDVLIAGEDDVVLADGALTMHTPAAQPATGRNGDVLVLADFGSDGTGAIQATGGGVDIDMNAEGVNPTGRLVLAAAEGIGDAAMPISTANLGELTAGTTTSGGIHLVNSGVGDVRLAVATDPGFFGPTPVLPMIDPIFAANDAIVVAAGDGDIQLVNQAGDLIVAGDVRAVGDLGSGGNVHLGVAGPGAEIRFQDPGGVTRVEAASDLSLDGPVLVVLDADLTAGGDVSFSDTIDSDATTLVTRNLTVTSGGVVRFGGDVGSGFALRNITIDGDVELAQDTSFSAVQTASFLGDVDAAADDAAALTIDAAVEVALAGDLGTTGRLRGVNIDSPQIDFQGVTDQSVVAGADGIALNADVALPLSTGAAIGKRDGGLRLESVGGSVEIGPNQKLTVDGLAHLVGDVVLVGDVNADAIQVESPDFRIRARAPGLFFVPGLGLVPDAGTDLLANTISTTSAPTVTGSGEPPRLATASGVVDGAGAGTLGVVSLSAPITSADLVDAASGDFLDLGIGIPDPGNETEPTPPTLDPLLPARPGKQDAAGSATAPGDDAVLAFLQCSEGATRDEDARACAPAPGSPLDSPRGEEIAARHRRLFGSSSEARAARGLMTGSTAAASAVRRDLVALLAQLRLLGMEEQAYQRVRDQLLESARGAQSREALLGAVRAEARGLPL